MLARGIERPFEEEGQIFGDKAEVLLFLVFRRSPEVFQSNGKRAVEGPRMNGEPGTAVARRMHRTYEALPAFTASLNGLPALNVGAVEAAMFRLSPVLGLRPVRAGRLLVPKVPKPAIRTSSPLARASVIASNTVSTAFPAADLPTPARPATRPAMSDLFTRSLPALSCSPDVRLARSAEAEADAHG